MFCSTRKPTFICLFASVLFLPALSVCSCSASRRMKAIAHGNELFETHCGGCHNRRRLDLDKVPPDLNGVFDRGVLPSGRSATDDVVRSTILTGCAGLLRAGRPKLVSISTDQVFEITAREVRWLLLYVNRTSVAVTKSPPMLGPIMRSRKSASFSGGSPIKGMPARVSRQPADSLQKNLKTDRHNNLTMVQHNNLITVRRNNLRTARHGYTV
jgi:hypothetical protein